MVLKRLGMGCLGVSTGAAAGLAWISTAALAMNLQPMAIGTALAAAGLSWATWRIHRVLSPKRPPWDAAIRQAIAALPRRVRVRRSRAGRGSRLTGLAMTIYALGLLSAVIWAIGSQSGEGADALIWIVGGSGVVAGVLLAIARDGRMRRVEVGTVLGLPVTVTVLVSVPATGGAPDVGEWLLSLLTVFLFASVPVLVGFGIPRTLAWVYRSSRPIEAAPQAAAPSVALLPELEAATNHRRADAVLRTYRDSQEPHRLLEEDRLALVGAGYQLVAICERPAVGDDTGLRLLWLASDAEAMTAALFVRNALASGLTPPRAAASAKS